MTDHLDYLQRQPLNGGGDGGDVDRDNFHRPRRKLTSTDFNRSGQWTGEERMAYVRYIEQEDSRDSR